MLRTWDFRASGALPDIDWRRVWNSVSESAGLPVSGEGLDSEIS